MKFRGFYRLSKQVPAPVLALFTDSKDVYLQQSNEGETLDDYKKIETFDKRRIFVVNELKITPPRQGDQILYAYEYQKGSVAIGNLKTLKDRIGKLLEQGDIYLSSEFAQLEAAHFTENPTLIRKAAVQCFQKLNKKSDSLSRKWLEGSPIDSELRDWIIRNFSHQPADIKLRSVGFRISCLRLVMDTIDGISSEIGMDRNTFITLCIRRTYADLGENIRREFLGGAYRKIDIEINNFSSGRYTPSISKLSDDIRIALGKVATPPLRDEVTEYLLEHEIYFTSGLYPMRPSIRIGNEELDILRATFRGGPRQSERAKCAFILFCINENYRDFFDQIFGRLRKISESEIESPTSRIYRTISRYITEGNTTKEDN